MAASDFEVKGLDEKVKELKKIMTDDPYFQRRVNEAIRRILKEARKRVSEEAKTIFKEDPRHAYRAVRSSVYKKLLGGQLNILSRRKAGKETSYEKPKKGLPAGRGGNRWGISGRTLKVDNYEGMDRGFILRFVNEGTVDRNIHSYTGKDGNRHSLMSGNGNRGSLSGQNWFSYASKRALEDAMGSLQEFIDEIITKQIR